jgi:hypothetical protein
VPVPVTTTARNLRSARTVSIATTQASVNSAVMALRTRGKLRLTNATPAEGKVRFTKPVVSASAITCSALN